MRTVPLPPGVNPTTLNKCIYIYIYININMLFGLHAGEQHNRISADVQTGSVAQAATYSVSPGALSPGKNHRGWRRRAGKSYDYRAVPSA